MFPETVVCVSAPEAINNYSGVMWCDIDSRRLVKHQARSHWLGWSGFNLTTFIQLYNIYLVNPVTLQTDLTIFV